MWIPDPDQPLPRTKYSRQTVAFTCNCRFGTKRMMPWKNYGAGHSKSCGKCDFVVLSDLTDSYGKLTIDRAANNLCEPTSHNAKVVWKCECGGSKTVMVKSVLNGLTTSCGCALIGKSVAFVRHSNQYHGPKAKKRSSGTIKLLDPTWWLTTQFGNLNVIGLDKPIGRWSDIKLDCRCKCGNECRVAAKHLAQGFTNSCGRCAERGVDWWINKELSYPNSLESFKQFFEGSYLEPLTFSKKHPDVKCLMCSKIFNPAYHDLFLKKIVSCGCIQSASSRPNREIGAFVESLGLVVKYEERIASWATDIYVPAVDLVIEHHGLRYHSDQFKTTNKDLEKYNAISKSYRCLVIYGDEWHKNKPFSETLLLQHVVNYNRGASDRKNAN